LVLEVKFLQNLDISEHGESSTISEPGRESNLGKELTEKLVIRERNESAWKWTSRS
jgi:hypothetical protein